MRLAVFTAVALVGCSPGDNLHPAPDAPGTGADGGIGSVIDGAVDAPVTPPTSLCDGLPCTAVYVATTGDDSAAGTAAAPLKTVGAAITKAAAQKPVAGVIVQAGSYAEAVTMVAGVSIFGGVDATWKHADGAVTEIVGDSPAVTFNGITTATTLDHLTVRSNDGAAPSAPSIAVLVTGSQHIELDSVMVLPGSGANGANGASGGNGASGTAGKNGLPGMEHSSAIGCNNHTVPVGQAGGTSACGRSGGTGGN
ncbi:MAG TPA: hypothetical protein VFP84_28965, partial [Kofleriaceae bacterium]|nr:hypothetical protein [Kofleriaceae bacterium]